MNACSVVTCGRAAVARGFCMRHYQRFMRYGDAERPFQVRRAHEGSPTASGYMRVKAKNEKPYFVHDRVAERALGRPLPPGAVVHHVDGNPANNAPSNLVICPSQKYHALLHRRTDALDACGLANWRKCNICKRYDDPANLYIHERAGATHKACVRERRRAS